MEYGAPRLHVLGENEALQQFFNGHDVSRVLDSSVAVDTSILEQYLSNDIDANSCILPESPPDSCSEAFSPAQIPELYYKLPYWTNHQARQQVFEPTHSSSLCRYKGSSIQPAELLTHEQLQSLGLTKTSIKPGTTPAPPSIRHHSPEHSHYATNPKSHSQGYAPPTPPSPNLCSRFTTSCTEKETCSSGSSFSQASTSTTQSCSPESKKRRRSLSEEAPGIEAPHSEVLVSHCGYVGLGSSSAGGISNGSYNTLTWEQYTPGQWNTLLNGSYQSLSPLAYHVDTDKGFTYSTADEAFVCQKKNHFQVTVHIGMTAEPRYVRTPSGPKEVVHFEIRVFGIRLEDPSYHVLIEQSQSDRSKKPYKPVRVSLPSRKITKVTLGRLHFSETTANNIRKKGKPNPDQRYFQMVVGLYAVVKEEAFLLAALGSDRIIVRASNPGQFEMDGDTLWQRGLMSDAVVCQGRVGINTDSPDEALVVCGNAKVMGTIMQPSDHRIKDNIQEVDSEQQLKRINQMRIVEFDYKPEFASSMGIDQTHQTGIIAQEVKELLPSAVKEVGDVTCSDGEKIDNFLMVDKEQIFMENVGAVQQLSKLTNNLETRIQELEVWNQRLAKLKSLTGSLRSNRKSRKHSSVSTTQTTERSRTHTTKQDSRISHCVKHRIFQASIFTLLATMAFCVISITALYLFTLKEDTDNTSGHSNGSLIPPLTTDWSSTVPPTSLHGSWPPDVDFCDLFYCNQVYCCSSQLRGSTGFNISYPETLGKEYNLTEGRIEHFYHSLKRSRDWTNTSIQYFMIKENQQIIDSKYCLRDECGPSRFVYRVPISQFVPGNMRITLLMNSTELLVVHLCSFDETEACSALLDTNPVTGSRYPTNTQGEHEWPLHVAQLYHSSYHFRSAVAGQADCNTDHHFAGVLFTDYFFHFYRRCTE